MSGELADEVGDAAIAGDPDDFMSYVDTTETAETIELLPTEPELEENTNPYATVPALFNHCVEVWEMMHSESQQVTLDDNGMPLTVQMWEGYTTKLFRTLRLAVPQYTKVMQALQAMDCVRQIRRGGGSAMSQWALIQYPKLDSFKVRAGTSYKSKAGQASVQNAQQIRDLNRRLSDLEQKMENHVRAHR